MSAAPDAALPPTGLDEFTMEWTSKPVPHAEDASPTDAALTRRLTLCHAYGRSFQCAVTPSGGSGTIFVLRHPRLRQHPISFKLRAATLDRACFLQKSAPENSMTRKQAVRSAREVIMGAVLSAEALASSTDSPSRGRGEMFTHLRRVTYSHLASEWLPAFVRMRLMRKLGASIADTACVWSGCSFRSMSVELGEHVFINVGFFFDGAAPLRIERNVRIGQFVRVITATHEIGPAEQRCTVTPRIEPVVIEAGCWIGANVTIMPGVTIARGCVIGASSTVFSSTEPNGLYAGVPARRIKDLESETADTKAAAAA